MEAEISPQLLVNIFVPNTPLHDGAVVISGGRIKAAACMLPLAGDKDIARELGTRHRAAIKKQLKIIAYLKQQTIKKILIKNLITKRQIETKRDKINMIKKLKGRKKEA